MSLMPYNTAILFGQSQTNIIWKHVNWHVQRHISLIENGFMYAKGGKLRRSKIVRLKPNING